MILVKPKPVEEKRAVFEASHGGVTVILVRVGDHHWLAKCLAVVGGAHGHDAPALEPFGVGRGDVAVSGIEDAKKVAVAQPANIREGGVTPCGLA
jgi:hypothetical protein